MLWWPLSASHLSSQHSEGNVRPPNSLPAVIGERRHANQAHRFSPKRLAGSATKRLKSGILAMAAVELFSLPEAARGTSTRARSKPRSELNVGCVKELCQ